MFSNNFIYNLINTIITIFTLISLIIFNYYVFRLNIIPDKYMIFFYLLEIITILILTILIIISFKANNPFVKLITIVLVMIATIGILMITNYFKNTYHFIKKTQVDYDTLTYSVIVKKNSDYFKLIDLNGRNIAYLNNDNSSLIKEELEKTIRYNAVLDYEFTDSCSMLLSEGIDAVILEDSYLKLAYEEIDKFESDTKVIYDFTIKVEAHKEEVKEETEKVNIKEPFILYISGIDQYGNVGSVRGRSDVNQILVINPKTNHILIANTPRDYYVQLDGTTGLRDKLTHAGIYGVDKSIRTLENLYGIDINHYIRVNFDTLINVLDIIGGIDIESDSSFRCWTDRSVYVNKGWNHFNGKQALAYSRERKAYSDGDNHRGRNQQQVLETIINKLTQTNTFISKYNDILKSLDKTFQTDMDTSLITDFIKYQLDKMPSWNVESIQATGYASWNYTYSMGYNYYLWVMEPDYDSVNYVKNRIIEVLNEE